MIGIVIVAHGGLAQEYLAVLEHVVGKCSGIAAVSIEPDDTAMSKQREVANAVASVDRGDGVVAITDMYGGTPSNLTYGACTREDHRMIYGVNMPMLIKLAQMREHDLDVAVKCALNAGRKDINSVSGFGSVKTPVAL